MADDSTRVQQFKSYQEMANHSPQSRQAAQFQAMADEYAQQQAAPAPSAGAPMPAAVQARMEQSFGADFSAVRIHVGPQARALGAVAYTQGSDIHFAPGRYDPVSQRGQELLGHELAHVEQQRAGRVHANASLTPVTQQAAGPVRAAAARDVAINDDSALEREADEMGARAARGEPVSAAGQGAWPGTIAHATPAQRSPVVQRRLTAPSQTLGAQADAFREAMDTALSHDLFEFDPHAVDLRNPFEQPAKDAHLETASATVSQAAISYMAEAARRNNPALALEAVELIQRIPDFTTRVSVIRKCLDLHLAGTGVERVVNALCDVALRAPISGLVDAKYSMLIGMEDALRRAQMPERAADMAGAAGALCTKEEAVYLQGAMLVHFVTRMYEHYPALVIATVTRFCELAYSGYQDIAEDPTARRTSAGSIGQAVGQALRNQPASAEELLETVRDVIGTGAASEVGVADARAKLTEALNEAPLQPADKPVDDGSRTLRASINARVFATRIRTLLKQQANSARHEQFQQLQRELDAEDILGKEKDILTRKVAYIVEWRAPGFLGIDQIADIEMDAAQTTLDLLGRVEALDASQAGAESRAEAFAILAEVKARVADPGHARTLTIMLLARIQGLDSDRGLSDALKNQTGLRAWNTLGMTEENAEALATAVTGPDAGLAGAATTRLIFAADADTFKLWYRKLGNAEQFSDSPVHASTAAAFVAYALHGQRDPSAIIRAFTMLDPAVVQKLAKYVFTDAELAGPLLARLAVLRKFALQESGGNYTTFADFLITLARASSYRLPDETEQRQRFDQIQVQNEVSYSTDFMVLLLSTPPAELAGKAQELGAEVSYERNYGRTLVFKKGNTYVAVKLRKRGESDDELDLEWRHMAHKRGLNLASLVPTPVAVHKSQLPLDNHYASQITTGPHPVNIDADHHCLVYESPSKELWRYVNDTDVEAKGRSTGILSAARDLFTLARLGEVDPALTVKNHNVEGGQRRSYEVLIDIMNPPTSRLGAGRLDKVDVMNQFPNVRTTGLTDLPDNRFISDLVAENERQRDQAAGVTHRLNWQEKPTADRLYMARYLADYLFDLTLLTGTAYQKQGLLKPDQRLDEHMRALQAELEALFKTAFATFTGEGQELAARFLTAAVNFPRLAKQVSFYLEPEAYTAVLDSTVDWQTEERDERTRYVGEVHKKDETDQACAVLRNLHGTDNVTLSLLYNRGCYIPRDKIIGTQVPGNAHDLEHEHPDLGMVNGSNPLTELERALYVASAMMISI